MQKALLGVCVTAVTLLPLLGSGPSKTADRGKYLADQIAMCTDCHTPHGPTGPDKAQWLQGATLGFQPTVRMPAWAPYAPMSPPVQKSP